jgi:hypothetical protein
MAYPKWTTEKRTWVTAGEVLALAGLLAFAPPTLFSMLLGLPLALHLGWSVLTSVPIGAIPGPPPGIGERRQNHQLRYRVVEFTREVQRLEAYARRLDGNTTPPKQLARDLRKAEERLHNVVSEAVRAVGQSGV